jgi:uncharacterized membrane protein YkoI
MKHKLYLAEFIALSAAAIGIAHAAQPTENDALAISGAKIDMVQAVKAAEQHTGGKAARAEYEHHNGQWVFDVEVVNGRKVMDVKVDPTSGQVILATEDKADHDDGD